MQAQGVDQSNLRFCNNVYDKNMISQKVTLVNSATKIGGDFRTPAQWTMKIIGQMHLYGITGKVLAEELGWNPKYLSRVLHSEVAPRGAEEKVSSALDRLISAKCS